jgi:RHS repeat-associated protein
MCHAPFDPETGLSDFGMRYYGAPMGRWISRDPLGDFGGANVYAYVANNPTTRTAYLGMRWTPARRAGSVLLPHTPSEAWVTERWPRMHRSMFHVGVPYIEQM